MQKIILIGTGGALGTLLRYFVSGIEYKISSGAFPIGTMVVNVTGSLVIGFLWGFFERVDVPSNLRMFIFMGILGGYTTFSTFALESSSLFRDGEIKMVLLNILMTNGLGIAAVFVGFSASRWLPSLAR